jgi:photosystem II stability/assembly factor-like uncharacterized protein
MQTRNLRLALVFVLTLAVCRSTRGQSAGQIESMKLLTADTGWAATRNKLFWTTDGGSSWKDITPKLNHKKQMISSVFFLGPSTGWVLLHCGDDKDPLVDDVCFEFASTTDSGEDWIIAHPKITDPVPQAAVVEDGQGLSSTSFINFADGQHGWAILARKLPVGRSSGTLLRTTDGGRTWDQLPQNTLPVAGALYFSSPKAGWLAGGPDQELYDSRDGGNSWQHVELPTPSPVSRDLSAVYGLPTFVDGKTGYLTATYESSTSVGVPMSLFMTQDGGITWHAVVITSPLPDTHPWTAYPSSIVAGEVLTAQVSKSQITLSRAGQGHARKDQTARIPMSASSADQLSFVDPDRGWILAGYWLLSTADGGVTWSDATPNRTETVPASASSGLGAHINSRGATGSSSSIKISSRAPTIGAPSTHLGFDTFPTPPTSTMLAWQNSSPFYDSR